MTDDAYRLCEAAGLLWHRPDDRALQGIASRLVIYLASHCREVDPKTLEHWGEVARAVLKTGWGL